MKLQLVFFLSLYMVLPLFNLNAQQNTTVDSVQKVAKLFKNKDILPIKLSYSIKNVKKESNDSTYIESNLHYLANDGIWKTIEVQIRTRGNYRLKNCYYPPVKLKIDKAQRKGTMFRDNKKIKVVLPCLTQKGNNDYVVKEYLAYQLFEIISPYYLKSRLLDIHLTEIQNKKEKTHELKGIFVEDDEKAAKRYGGKVFNRPFHPQNQDDLASVRMALFQYMVGNTDFSTAYQHNAKLLFIDKKMIPIAYDFDMAGLVNTNYAVVSNINGETLELKSVRDRLYRGFQRNPKTLEQVRKEFIDHEPKIMAMVNSLEKYFESKKQFNSTKNYIHSFYTIIKNNALYQDEIINKLRTK